jgi:hypothetical protein
MYVTKKHLAVNQYSNLRNAEICFYRVILVVSTSNPNVICLLKLCAVFVMKARHLLTNAFHGLFNSDISYQGSMAPNYWFIDE